MPTAKQTTYHPVRGGDAEQANISATGVVDVAGAINANGGVVGNLTGNVVGNVTGNLTGGAKGSFLAVSANGAITIPLIDTTYVITKGTAAAITLADPTTVTHDGLRLIFLSTTAAAHTVDNSAGSGFFSSGGASKDVATFGGAIGDGFAVIAYGGKWYIDPRGVTNVTLG